MPRPTADVLKFPKPNRKPRMKRARPAPKRTKHSPAAVWLTGLRFVLSAGVQLLAAATLLRLIGWAL
jgi:hypothetical protein